MTLQPWLAASAIVLVLGLVGCQQQPRHVSGGEFQREYELRHQQTMHYANYLGEQDGKVFLRRKNMSLLNQREWREELLYTTVEELDPSFLSELREHGHPDK